MKKALTYVSPPLEPGDFGVSIARAGQPAIDFVSWPGYYWLLGAGYYWLLGAGSPANRRLEISTIRRRGSRLLYLRRSDSHRIWWGKASDAPGFMFPVLISELSASPLGKLITAKPRAFYARLIK